MDHADAGKLLRLTPLAPDLVEAVLDGQRHLRGLARGPTDDLVLALAMACWYFERSRRRPRTRLSAEVLGPASSPVTV